MIAASYWGKWKTTFQMAMIILLIFNFKWLPLYVLTQIVIYVSLALTIISLVDYILKNKKVLSSTK